MNSDIEAGIWYAWSGILIALDSELNGLSVFCFLFWNYMKEFEP